MSDRDAWPENPNDVSEGKKASSGSGCFKIFLIVGALGLFCMVLCCGGGFFVARKFAPTLTQNPAEVAQVGQRILKIDIPPDFEGNTAMTMDNFFVNFEIAVYKRKQGDGKLFLGKLEIKLKDQAAAKAATKGFHDQFPGADSGDSPLQIEKTETREFEIGGDKIPFRFSEAVEPESQKQYRIVQAQIGTPVKGVFFRLESDAETYDEDQVVKMIESIQKVE